MSSERTLEILKNIKTRNALAVAGLLVFGLAMQQLHIWVEVIPEHLELHQEILNQEQAEIVATAFDPLFWSMMGLLGIILVLLIALCALVRNVETYLESD